MSTRAASCPSPSPRPYPRRPSSPPLLLEIALTRSLALTQDSQTYLTTKIQYPGIGNETTYSEKLLVGYRWCVPPPQSPTTTTLRSHFVVFRKQV
jgi:hypothetical protein